MFQYVSYQTICLRYTAILFNCIVRKVGVWRPNISLNYYCIRTEMFDFEVSLQVWLLCNWAALIAEHIGLPSTVSMYTYFSIQLLLNWRFSLLSFLFSALIVALSHLLLKFRISCVCIPPPTIPDNVEQDLVYITQEHSASLKDLLWLKWFSLFAWFFFFMF